MVLYFQDESRSGLLTVLRRMITAKGLKPAAPYLYRFDDLYLFGAYSSITGHHLLLEMPYCNSQTFQTFFESGSSRSGEFKIMLPDNGSFHHAGSLRIPKNVAIL